MDAITKTIARAELKKEIDLFPSIITSSRRMRYAVRGSIRFALSCYDEAKKAYREYRLEKIIPYLEKRKIRIEKKVFALSDDHQAQKKYIGCFISPFGDDAGRKTSGQMSFLQSMTLEVIALSVGHNRGECYTQYVCKVKSHPAKSFGGNHYKKNELAGMIYTFDHVSV